MTPAKPARGRAEKRSVLVLRGAIAQLTALENRARRLDHWSVVPGIVRAVRHLEAMLEHEVKPAKRAALRGGWR